MKNDKAMVMLACMVALACCLAVARRGACADEPYERWIGHLPKNKAQADANRMLDVMNEFQKKHLKPGECIQFFGKHGTMDLLNVVNEEGRGFTPPRSGYETELFNRIKDFVEKNPGTKIDPETLLRLGLESCVGPQGVSLQDAVLTIHNIVRILARPESWTDRNYEPGWLIWTPSGNVELTKGKDLPGWSAMTNDPVFPILKDLGGISPTVAGRKTFAELMNPMHTPAAIQKRVAEHQAALDAKIAALRPRIAEVEARIAAEKRDAEEEKRLEQTWTPDKMTNKPGPDWAEKQRKFFERMKRIETMEGEIRSLEGEIRGLEMDKQKPVLHGEDFQNYFFDMEKGVFSAQYGAKGQIGNGGCTYYYWLGALARTFTVPGKAVEKGAWWYERAQKWFGNEDEYARGLLQLSHFEGGGTFGGMAMGAIIRCNLAKKPDGFKEPSWFVSAIKRIQDWYCTNRPEIKSPAPLPPVITSGSGAYKGMPWMEPQK